MTAVLPAVSGARHDVDGRYVEGLGEEAIPVDNSSMGATVAHVARGTAAEGVHGAGTATRNAPRPRSTAG